MFVGGEFIFFSLLCFFHVREYFFSEFLFSIPSLLGFINRRAEEKFIREKNRIFCCRRFIDFVSENKI